MNVGKKVISLRERKGWTQKELASRVNINVSVMNRIESNERPVKDNELLKLANVFGCSTDHILGREEKPTNKNEDEEEFLKWMNDPTTDLFFKEYIESPEEMKDQLRKIWDIIKQQQKK